MLDRSLTGGRRINYYVRGPERAWLVPQGDLEALADVFRRESRVWNGVNTLIVGVTSAGRVSPEIKEYLRLRTPDVFYAHDSLPEQVAARLNSDYSPGSRWYQGFDAQERHPLDLVEPSSVVRPLAIPTFEQDGLNLVRLLAWGDIPDGDVTAWQDKFQLRTEPDPERAAIAMLAAQLGRTSPSPLLLSATGMGMATRVSPQDHPYLAVVHEPSFQQLVDVWNFRAHHSSFGTAGAPVVVIPRQHLRFARLAGPLKAWAVPPEGHVRRPVFLVHAHASDRPAAEALLTGGGMLRDPVTRLESKWSSDAAVSGPVTFEFAAFMTGGRFERGSPGSALAHFIDGQASVQLDLPEVPGLDSGHMTRLTLVDLPLPLPLTPTAARRLHPSGVVSHGLMVNYGPYGSIDASIRLPTRQEALADWAADMGFEARVSRPGQYAEALLDRFSDPDELAVFENQAALSVLDRLAPVQRDKLVQRVRRELASEGRELSLDAIAERLGQVGSYLDLPVSDVTGFGRDKSEVLAAIAELNRYDLVVRGRRESCSICGIENFFYLSELDETVDCRACRAQFRLRIAVGQDEPRVDYRLDGLMARIMDQDVVPVLLALRAAFAQFESDGERLTAWPGVLFRRNGRETDVDLLVARKDLIAAFEIKHSGDTLSERQLSGLLELCVELGARPGLACLRGDFAPVFVERIRRLNGFVFNLGQG